MVSHETTVRVRYGETDQMGVVYHGHYVQYLEVSRAELMRNLGFSYAKLESMGIMMPVTGLEISFRKPARYDDLLTLRAILKEMPDRRMIFETQIYSEDGYKLVTGKVSLAFVNKESGRPVRAPEVLLNILKEHWQGKA